MLALLRVAPLLPSPPLCAVAIAPRSGRESRLTSIEQESQFGRALLGGPLMHFYSDPPMHFLSAVDRRRPRPHRRSPPNGQEAGTPAAGRSLSLQPARTADDAWRCGPDCIGRKWYRNNRQER
jgi:hypothetical protein